MAGLCRILTTATLVVHLTVGCCALSMCRAARAPICPSLRERHPAANPTECECEHSEHPHGNQSQQTFFGCSAPHNRVITHFPPFQAYFLASPNDQTQPVEHWLPTTASRHQPPPTAGSSPSRQSGPADLIPGLP